MSKRPTFRPANGLLALVLGLALLSGCGTPPAAYQRPDPRLPASWGQASATAAVPTALPWQSLYTDARLQALIRTALERNHDLRLALTRIEEARALWGVQGADQWPAIALGASHTGARTPALVQGNPGAVNVRRYDLGLNLLSFEVDVWGRVASLTDAARLNFQASEEDRRTIRIGLVNDVVNAYFTWLEAQQRLGLLRQVEQNREQALQLTQRRNATGAGSKLEVSLAQSARLNARADAQAMQRQSGQAFNALQLLLGGQWPAPLPVGLSMPLQSIDLAWGADLSSDTLLQRPDVKAAEQRLMAAHANIQVARTAFLPRIQLTGLLGTASPALNNLLGGGSQTWNFVPSLQQPLFDAGRNEAGLDLALARKNQAVVLYEKTLQQAFREVADALITRDTLGEQLRDQTASLDVWRERERLIGLRQRHGAASLSEWLDAQRDVLQAEQAQAQTRRLWLLASAQIFKALGGGDL
jgi:multidrug efflux system outer membrane protein